MQYVGPPDGGCESASNLDPPRLSLKSLRRRENCRLSQFSSASNRDPTLFPNQTLTQSLRVISTGVSVARRFTARDMARPIARSWEGRVSRRLRKKVEMLFAHLKRILKLAIPSELPSIIDTISSAPRSAAARTRRSFTPRAHCGSRKFLPISDHSETTTRTS